jgi:hypothetical protein
MKIEDTQASRLVTDQSMDKSCPQISVPNHNPNDSIEGEEDDKHGFKQASQEIKSKLDRLEWGEVSDQRRNYSSRIQRHPLED